MIFTFLVPTRLCASSAPGPLEQSVAAFGHDDYVAADKWLDTAIQDFDGTTKISAQALKVLLALSRELGHVKVARYLSDGSELELKDKKRWRQRIDALEIKATNWGKRSIPNFEPLMAFKHLPKVTFNFQLSLENLLGNKEISRIGKGEWISDKDIDSLIDHETKRHLVGVFQDVLGSSDSDFASGRFSGQIRWEVFFRTVGVRTYLLGRRLKDQALMRLAKNCFEKVILYTATEPYHPDRKRAQDFIAAIEKNLKKNSKKSTKR